MRGVKRKQKKRKRPLANWIGKRAILAASSPEDAAKLRQAWKTFYSSVAIGQLLRFEFRKAEQLAVRTKEYLAVELSLRVPNDGYRCATDDWFWEMAKRHLENRVENIGDESAWELVHDIKNVFGIDFSDKLIDILHWQQGVRPTPKRPKPK